MHLSTEVKIILGITLATIIILVAGIFLLTKNEDTNVPEDQIVAKNGLHWHPKLTIYINGQKQEFTDNIGLGAVHQPMHTHVEDYKDGVIHMEMEGVVTKDETKLSNFFKVWGKEFSSTQIFDKKSTAERKITMAVNGKESKDYGNYLMKDGDKIEIRY